MITIKKIGDEKFTIMIEKNKITQYSEDGEVINKTIGLDSLLSGVSSIIEELPNVKLPSPSLLQFYANEKNRVIWLQDEVDGTTLEIIKSIIKYNVEDKDIPIAERKPIKIFIDTVGGNVVVMWSLIQAIKLSKTPVWTINFCEALSAGFHILAAGHKRFGMPGSTVLIHSGSCSYSGTQEQAESAKKYYDGISKRADEELLKNTKIDPKVLKKKSPFDWYISDVEAVQYGIIDKIIDNFEEIM